VFLNGSKRCFLMAALCLSGATVAQAQSSAEYGAATANSGTMVAKVKAPISKITLPTATSAPGAAAAPASRASVTGVPSADAAAANNRLAFEKKAGPDAAEISLRSVPNNALVWVDMQFVGATPLTLKLAPGPHRVRMSARDMQAEYEDVDLVAKQPKEVVLSLKPRTAE
jgi:PEGA domain